MASICHDLMAEPVQIQELAGFLDRLEYYPQEAPKSETSERMIEFKKLVDSNQNASIMLKLIGESDLVFDKGNETEIANFFALCGTLLMKLKEETLTQFLTTVLEKLKSNTDDKKQLRLQILGDIFNLAHDNDRRFQVLLSLFEYAAASGQSDIIHAQFAENQEEWIDALHLTAAQKEEFVKALQTPENTSNDDVSNKIRLLSEICAEKSQVTFAEVSAKLAILESEVEMWIVDVVTQGLIDVKINQPQKTINVRHVEQQVFHQKQWEQLGRRVDAVRQNFTELIQVVETKKA